MNVFQVTQTRPTSLQDVSSPSRLEILNIIIITVQSNKSSRPVFFLLWFVSRSSPDSSGQYKPCQHVWGPCSADHSPHTSRSSSVERHSRGPGSPWTWASTATTSPVSRKIKIRKNMMINEKETKSERFERLEILSHLLFSLF